MNYSVVYATSTGNTKLLADNVAEVLGSECVYFGQPDEKAKKSDIIFIGFWTDKGTCNEEIKDFISEIKDKKVFLFGSAGAGDEDYLNMVINNVKKEINKSCEVIGEFMCQGKMQQGVKARYEKMLAEKPGDEQILSLIKNFEEALNHPNEDDLTRLKNKVKEVVEK